MSVSGAGVQLAFPPSRTCLWDRRPAGEPVQMSVDCSCFVGVRVSHSVLQLAVRASRQTSPSPLHCLLLGSAFISQEEGVVIEVDRFDAGRRGGSGLQPTAVVPGDVVLHCTVGPEEAGPTPDPASLQVAVSTLCRTLASPLPSLEPTRLLHLTVLIAMHHSDSAPHNISSLSLSCQCVHPSACTLTPVTSLPIVQTALARNLAGPLPLPLLQASVKWGYLTMEVTRKLVLLLNSDPKSLSVPLVGFWLSGVSGVVHPAVWAGLLHYQHCSLLREREGGACLCLVYATGHAHPSLFEFRAQEVEGQEFTCSTAEACVELCASSPPLSLELLPSQSPALLTMLRTVRTPLSKDPLLATTLPHSVVTADYSLHRDQLLGPLPSSAPLPSPLPTLARDAQLSCVSFTGSDRHHLSHCSTSSSCQLSDATLLGSGDLTEPCGTPDPPLPQPRALSPPPFPQLTVFPDKQTEFGGSHCTEDLLRQQEQQLRMVQLQLAELLATHKTPTAERSTNTGWSLLQPKVLLPGEASAATSVRGEASVATSVRGETSVATSVRGETSVATSVRGETSAATSVRGETSVATSVRGETSVATSVRGETSVAMSVVSVATESSLPTSGSKTSVNLDLCSFASNSSVRAWSSSGCVDGERAAFSGEGDECCGSGLLHSDRQRFYHNMLAQVQDLLQSSPPDCEDQPRPLHGAPSLTRAAPPSSHTLPPSSSALPVLYTTSQMADLSTFPVPRILNSCAVCVDSTLDEATQYADAITEKYLGRGTEMRSGGLPLAGLEGTVSQDVSQSQESVSIATENYLHRHRLLPGQHNSSHQVLDVGRLRTLTKLI